MLSGFGASSLQRNYGALLLFSLTQMSLLSNQESFLTIHVKVLGNMSASHYLTDKTLEEKGRETPIFQSFGLWFL